MTKQKVYQDLVYRNKPFQKLIAGPTALPLASLSAPPFYFRAFSIPTDPTILEPGTG